MKTCLPALVALAVVIVSVTNIVIGLDTEAKIGNTMEQVWESMSDIVLYESVDDYGIKLCLDRFQRDWPQLVDNWSSHLAFCCAFRRVRHCIVHSMDVNNTDPIYGSIDDKLVTAIVAATQLQMLPDIDCHLFWDNTGLILCHQPAWVVVMVFILLIGLLMMVLYMITNLVFNYYRYRQLMANTVN